MYEGLVFWGEGGGVYSAWAIYQAVRIPRRMSLEIYLRSGSNADKSVGVIRLRAAQL